MSDRGLPEGFPADALKAGADAGYGEDAMAAEATRLMGAVKRGDAQAFDTLVERLRGRSFQIARGLVGSADDAMELSQEAFLKVYKARATYRDGDPFLPWFHRILRNTCFSFLRAEKRARSLSAPRLEGDADEDRDFEISDLSEEPGAEAQRSERARAFWQAFRGLSAKDREMIVLRHFQELSYKEIAAALGIPEGTVMSRLFHTRRRLRERLPADLFEGFLGERGM